MVIKVTVFSLYNKREKNKTSKQVLLSVLGVAILIVAVVGISFAAFTYSSEGQKENTISTGTVTMSYTEDTNGIEIQNAIPMTEDDGKKLNGTNNVFDFTVSATIKGKTTINYGVFAVKKTEDCTIPDSNIRLYLEESNDKSTGYEQVAAPAAFTANAEDNEFGAPTGTMKLASGSFTNSNTNGEQVVLTKYYRLRMWVDEAYQLSGNSQTYKVTVNVYGKGQD